MSPERSALKPRPCPSLDDSTDRANGDPELDSEFLLRCPESSQSSYLTHLSLGKFGRRMIWTSQPGRTVASGVEHVLDVLLGSPQVEMPDIDAAAFTRTLAAAVQDGRCARIAVALRPSHAGRSMAHPFDLDRRTLANPSGQEDAFVRVEPGSLLDRGQDRVADPDERVAIALGSQPMTVAHPERNVRPSTTVAVFDNGTGTALPSLVLTLHTPEAPQASRPATIGACNP